MEDLSFIKFKRLRKNKSEEDQKILHKKTLLDKKQSVETCPAEAGSSRQSYLDHSSLPSSLPSSPPAYHSVPFSARRLGDWARAKRLEEILTMFPADMSLLEFSHLTLTSPAVLSGGDPIIINNHLVVTDSRLKEKVMVAISAARAARRQVEAEVRIISCLWSDTELALRPGSWFLLPEPPTLISNQDISYIFVFYFLFIHNYFNPLKCYEIVRSD